MRLVEAVTCTSEYLFRGIKPPPERKHSFKERLEIARTEGFRDGAAAGIRTRVPGCFLCRNGKPVS